MDKINIIGLMTGTSCDGMDLCLIQCHVTNNIPMGKIIKTKYIKYSEDFTKDLLELNNSSISKISQAHMDLGKLWAKEINDWIKKNNLIIDMVGIHGQTIYHNGTHSSLQIGEPLYISKLLKVPVIYNFRIKDIINVSYFFLLSLSVNLAVISKLVSACKTTCGFADRSKPMPSAAIISLIAV